MGVRFLFWIERAAQCELEGTRITGPITSLQMLGSWPLTLRVMVKVRGRSGKGGVEGKSWVLRLGTWHLHSFVLVLDQS